MNELYLSGKGLNLDKLIHTCANSSELNIAYTIEITQPGAINDNQNMAV